MHSNPNRHIPAEPGRWRAFLLAVLVHMALLGLLWFGVSWQNVPPITVEAEIWNMEASEAGPVAPPPPRVLKPEPPKPEEPPKPVAPPKPALPPKPVEPPLPKVATPEPAKPKASEPDIALEKDKKRKLLKQKEEELEAKLKKEKLAEEAKLEAKQKKEKLAEAELEAKRKKEKLAEEAELEAKRKKEKLAEEAELEAKRKKEKLAEEKALQQAEAEKRKLAEEQELKKKIEEEKKRLAEEQKRKQEEALAAQRAKARREEDMRRLAGQAGDGNGNAEKTQSPKSDAGYTRLVGLRIKSNTIWTQETSSNQAVEFRVELLPDGSIRDVILLKSSENVAFDQAVKRAIYKTVPFPPDPSTEKVPTSIVVTHRPKDTEPR